MGLATASTFDAGLVFNELVGLEEELNEFDSVFFREPGMDESQTSVCPTTFKCAASDAFGDVHLRVVEVEPGYSFNSATCRLTAQEKSEWFFNEAPYVGVKGREPPAEPLQVLVEFREADDRANRSRHIHAENKAQCGKRPFRNRCLCPEQWIARGSQRASSR